jgi:predicted transcriptional regulator
MRMGVNEYPEPDVEEMILQALNHKERRKILKILASAPGGVTYSSILGETGLSTGRLNYHLKELSGFIERDDERMYHLTALGEKALSTLRYTTRAQTEGIFAFWPRIHYLNEAGETKVYESEPFSVTVVKPLQLMKGRCYLFASHERCLRTFKGLAQQGEPSLAIIRDDPETLIESGDMDKEDIVMLFSRGVRGYEAMSDIQEISWRISQRLHQGVRLVLLDGLEYLISRFGFDSVLRFLQEKRLNMLEADAIMLVPFDLDTVNDRQKAQLRSEMEII